MLRLALRLVTLVRTGELVDTLSSQIAARTRQAALTAGLCGLALILVIIGGIFVSVAVMLGLATVWPLHWAALTVGGLLIAAAGLVLLWVQSQQRREVPPPLMPAQPQKPPEWEELVRPVEAWARRHPGAAALGAIVAGVAVGLLSGEKGDRDTYPPDRTGRR